MTARAEPTFARCDARAIVVGGAKVGMVTVAFVVAFALLSRLLVGTSETVVQATLVLAGGATASFLPAALTRPRSADDIAWAALVGLLGALVFTLVDTVLLRPLGLYHWRWDAIGGGSGFWYIPVWWMGSATLAWLGAWAAANRERGRGAVNFLMLAGQSLVVALVILALITLVKVAPATPAVAALAYAASLVIMVPATAMLGRR